MPLYRHTGTGLLQAFPNSDAVKVFPDGTFELVGPTHEERAAQEAAEAKVETEGEDGLTEDEREYLRLYGSDDDNTLED